MEFYLEEYLRWKNSKLPQDLRDELLNMEDDKEEIYDRFAKAISFGTSGIRGKMGVGTNRVNSLVFKKATLGVSEYLTSKHKFPNVVIGYDTRINSKEYAQIIAEIFASQGVKVYIFKEATPVPVLSYAIRSLLLDGGVMITASHNPKEYNGYKVYDHIGNQIDEDKAKLIEKLIQKRDYFEEVGKVASSEETDFADKITVIPEELKIKYLKDVNNNIILSKNCKEDHIREIKNLKVAYTSLNGGGINYVPEALMNLGINEENLWICSSQRDENGNFPTCPSPNPEYETAFSESLNMIYCKSQESRNNNEAFIPADIVLGTDPDCDRMGLMVLDNNQYVHLNGNQVGTLIFDYILRNYEAKKDEKLIAYKSYVTTPLVEEMGKKYSVEVRNVFTGFKNIVKEIERIKKTGEGKFIFGFEESIGYLYGDYTRDKDGVMACQLTCLMVSELKMTGKTPVQRLNEIYEELGFLETITTSIYYKGEREKSRMYALIKEIFKGKIKEELKFQGYNIIEEESYIKENMYLADFEKGHRLIIRPSGTEPKLKVYIFARGASLEEAIDSGADISNKVRQLIKLGSN